MRGTQDENNTGDFGRGGSYATVLLGSELCMVERRGVMKYDWKKTCCGKKIKIDWRTALYVIAIGLFHVIS
jgi:hypothetical protein